jgi:hypothetical protein
VRTLRRTWESGLKVMKCIGFDATEDHRVGGGGTYATAKNLNIAPDPDLPDYKDRYDVMYPLREWGLDRKACGQTIVDAGLPLPPKSACFFCPAMRGIEIERLKVLDPDLYQLAVEMERLYRTGKHFRGDNAFTVKAVRKDTKEKVELEMTGVDVADVRNQFRQLYDDTARPYRYKVRIYPAVPGLGRSHAWGDHEFISAPQTAVSLDTYSADLFANEEGI